VYPRSGSGSPSAVTPSAASTTLPTRVSPPGHVSLTGSTASSGEGTDELEVLTEVCGQFEPLGRIVGDRVDGGVNGNAVGIEFEPDPARLRELVE